MAADEPFVGGSALNASPIVTAGFVILPLLAAAGFVLGCDRASRTLGEEKMLRLRRDAMVAAAVLVWLLATALLATSGVLRRFDATPPAFGLLALAVIIVGIASIASAAWFFLDAPSTIVFGIAALFAIPGLAGLVLLQWISQRS